jgi:hypothetical protein
MAADNGRLWSAPVEVPASELHAGTVLDWPKYEFCRDVVRRLEQTKAGFAVAYQFASEEAARAYRGYTARRLHKDLGEGAMQSRVRRHDDGTWHVYVARGSQYETAARGSTNRK